LIVRNPWFASIVGRAWWTLERMSTGASTSAGDLFVQSGQHRWITRQRLILPTAAMRSWDFGNHISLYEQQQQQRVDVEVITDSMSILGIGSRELCARIPLVRMKVALAG
jgi:hypothetical protein